MISPKTAQKITTKWRQCDTTPALCQFADSGEWLPKNRHKYIVEVLKLMGQNKGRKKRELEKLRMFFSKWQCMFYNTGKLPKDFF